MRVLEPCGELDLAAEALGAERRGEIGVQHLERDRTVVLRVLREVDRGHPAAPELALDRVARAERRLQLVLEVRRHRVCRLASGSSQLRAEGPVWPARHATARTLRFGLP